MKKPKAERIALRAEKYEKKVAAKATFSDVLKASAEHARRVAKKKKG